MSSKPSTRAKRKAVGFEFNPPRCINCRYYQPPIYGVPGKTAYRAPKCEIGGFNVNPHSICDLWTGRNGDVLEAS